MEDGARRPPSYLKMAFLGCWRTGHGDHRPTCRWLFWVLEDGARRPPSYLKRVFLGAGGGCIRLDKNLLLSAKTPKSIHMVHPSKYVRQYLAQVLQ